MSVDSLERPTPSQSPTGLAREESSGSSPKTAEPNGTALSFDDHFVDKYRISLQQHFHAAAGRSRARILMASLILISMVVLMFFVAKGGFFEQLSKERPDNDIDAAFLSILDEYRSYASAENSLQAYVRLIASHKTLMNFATAASEDLAKINAQPAAQGLPNQKAILDAHWKRVSSINIPTSNSGSQNLLNFSSGSNNRDGKTVDVYYIFMNRFRVDGGVTFSDNSYQFFSFEYGNKPSGSSVNSMFSSLDTGTQHSLMNNIVQDMADAISVFDARRSEVLSEKDKRKAAIMLRLSQLSSNIVTFTSALSYRLIAMFSIFAVSVFALRWITNELKFTISQNKAFFVLMALPTPINSVEQMKSIIGLTTDQASDTDSGEIMSRLLDLLDRGIPKKG